MSIVNKNNNRYSLYDSKEETIIKSIVFFISAATTFFPAYLVIVSNKPDFQVDQTQYSGFALTTFVYSLTLFMEGSTIKNNTSFFSKPMIVGLESTAATLLISSLGIISVSNKADFRYNLFSLLPFVIVCTTVLSIGVICFNLVLFFLFDNNLTNKKTNVIAKRKPKSDFPEYHIKNIEL